MSSKVTNNNFCLSLPKKFFWPYSQNEQKTTILSEQLQNNAQNEKFVIFFWCQSPQFMESLLYENGEKIKNLALGHL
jgi:hypothetical protein